MCGLLQALTYFDKSRQHLTLRPSTASFRLGETVYESEEKLKIRIPVTQDRFISFNVDVVIADIPLLIEQNDLKKQD